MTKIPSRYFCERMVDYGNNMSAVHPPHLFGGWAKYLYVVPGSFLVWVPDELPKDATVRMSKASDSMRVVIEPWA